MTEYFIRKDSINYDINSFALEKELERAISSCTVSLVKTDRDNINVGDEVSIGYDDGGFVTEFAGRVYNKEEYNEVILTVLSYGAAISYTNAEEIFEDKSPEYIAEYLVTNYTDLTYASTATSGLVISRFIVNGEPIIDAFKYLLDLLTDWTIKSDNDKNFYFEPKSTTISSESITINQNAELTKEWAKNPDKIVNQIILVGDVQTFSTDQDGFTAVGGETTIQLSYKPKGNVKIIKNGTELTGGVEGRTGTYDYTLNKDTGLVTLQVALTAGNTVAVFYEYEIPIKITAENEESIALYGLRSKKVTNNGVKTMNDARSFVQNYLVKNSLEDISGEFVVSIDSTLQEGQLVYVIDEFNNIDTQLLVNSIKVEYPAGTKICQVGRLPPDDLQQKKDINDRLKKLEQQFDNSDLLQLYRAISESININIISTVYAYQRDLIYNPLWDVAEWDVDLWDEVFDGYLVEDDWTISASSSFSDGQLIMDSSVSQQTASYAPTPSYSIIDGKIIIRFDRDASTGNFYIRFRKQDANNYYYINCDFLNDEISLYKYVSGSPTIIGSSVGKTYSATGNILYIRFNDGDITVNDESNYLLEESDTDITTTGTIEYSNNGNTVTITTSEFYEGV